MNAFWMFATSLTLLALLFVAIPLLRARSRDNLDVNELNTRVIREQLDELRADLEAGKLDEAAFDAAQRDLQRELLDDLDRGDGAAAAEKSGRWALVLLAVAIPATAVLVYLQLGTTDFDRPPPQASATDQGAGQAAQHSLPEMVAKLEERLAEQPSNAEGWVLLGRSYAALGRYDSAVEAYVKARELVGDHPDLLTDYADMLVMANGGTFTPQIGELLETALDAQADNAKALWLMGHYRFRQGDIADAIDYWQRTAALLPSDSENAAAIAQQITQARAMLGESDVASAPVGGSAAAADESAAPETAAAEIEVTVKLDPALQAQAGPDDTLFVFARAAQGPRMPLAIVRKQVRDLPLTVTLDDSMAMSPAMVLSNFAKLTVGARVSKTGNAMPASGDLQGELTPVTPAADASVEVIIDQVVP